MIIEEEPLYADVTVVDDALDANSTNPVQNKVITAALSNKASVGSTITNISINNPLNNQVLVFNGTNWVNGALTVSGGSSSPSTIPSLDDLTDVNISNPQDNQVLTYDNGSWVNSIVVSDGNGNSITVDGTVTENGENAVTSAGIYSFLAGKADIDHTHEIADVTGLSTALAGKSDSEHTHAYSSITDAPTFTPDSALNLSSTNTVENGVVTAALNSKVSNTQIATTSAPGLVQIGSGITVTNTGVISYAIGTDGGVVFDSESRSLYINEDSRRGSSGHGKYRVDLQTIPGFGLDIASSYDTTLYQMSGGYPFNGITVNTMGLQERIPIDNPYSIAGGDVDMWLKYFVNFNHTSNVSQINSSYSIPAHYTSGDVGQHSVAVGGYCNCATYCSTIINGGYCYDQQGGSVIMGSYNTVACKSDIILKCLDCYVVSGAGNILLSCNEVRVNGSNNFISHASHTHTRNNTDPDILGSDNILLNSSGMVEGDCCTLINNSGSITGDHSHIFGGYNNSIEGDHSVIINGRNIHIYGNYCTALGGADYSVYQDNVTVIGYSHGGYAGRTSGRSNNWNNDENRFKSVLNIAENANVIVRYQMPYSSGYFVIENQEIVSVTYTQDSLDASYYQNNNKTALDTVPFYIEAGRLIPDNHLRHSGHQDVVSIDFTIIGDAPLDEDAGDNE